MNFKSSLIKTVVIGTIALGFASSGCGKLNTHLEDDRLNCGTGYNSGDYFVVHGPDGRRLSSSEFEVINLTSSNKATIAPSANGCVVNSGSETLLVRSPAFEWGVVVEAASMKNRGDISLLRFANEIPKINCDETKPFIINRQFSMEEIVSHGINQSLINGYGIEYESSGANLKFKSGPLQLSSELASNKPFLLVAKEDDYRIKISLKNYFDSSKDITTTCAFHLDLSPPNLSFKINSAEESSTVNYHDTNSIVLVNPADSISIVSNDKDITEVNYCLTEINDDFDDSDIDRKSIWKNQTENKTCELPSVMKTEQDGTLKISRKTGFWHINYWAVDAVGNVALPLSKNLLFFNNDLIHSIASDSSDKISALIANGNSWEGAKAALQALKKSHELSTKYERNLLEPFALIGLLKIQEQKQFSMHLEVSNAMINTIEPCAKEQKIVTGDSRGIVKLWDLKTQKIISTFDDNKIEGVDRMLVSSDCDTIISFKRYNFTVWDAASGLKVRTSDIPTILDSEITEAAWGEFKKNMIVTLADGSIRKVDIATDEVSLLVKGDASHCLPLSITQNKEQAVLACDGFAQFWDTKNDLLQQTLKASSTELKFANLSADETKALFYSDAGLIEVWDIKSSTKVKEWTIEPGYFPIYSRSDLIIFLSAELDLQFCNALTGEVLFKGKSSPTTKFDYKISEDGRKVMYVNPENFLQIWDLGQKPDTKTSEVMLPSEFAIPDPQDNEFFIATEKNGLIAVEEKKTKKSIVEFEPKFDNKIWNMRSLYYDPASSITAFTDFDGEIDLVDSKSGNLIRHLKKASESLKPLFLSNDKKNLVTITNSLILSVWNVSTGEEVKQKLLSREAEVETYVFDEAGKDLTIKFTNGLVDFFETETFAMYTIDTHTLSSTAAMAVDPLGKRLAIAGRDRYISVWDIKSNTFISRVATTLGDVIELKFDPDGETLYIDHLGDDSEGNLRSVTLALDLSTRSLVEKLCETVSNLGLNDECQAAPKP